MCHYKKVESTIQLVQYIINTRPLYLFRMNAGGGQVVANFQQPVILSTWHKIDVERNERTVTMTLNDDLRTTASLSKRFTVLDFVGQMFIGSPSTPVGRWVYCHHNLSLKYIIFDDLSSLFFSITLSSALFHSLVWGWWILYDKKIYCRLLIPNVVLLVMLHASNWLAIT